MLDSDALSAYSCLSISFLMNLELDRETPWCRRLGRFALAALVNMRIALALSCADDQAKQSSPSGCAQRRETVGCDDFGRRHV